MANPPIQLRCGTEENKSGTARGTAAPNDDKPPARTNAELDAKQRAAREALEFAWGFTCPTACPELKFELVVGEPDSTCVLMGAKWQCTATCYWSVRVSCGARTTGLPGAKEIEAQDLKCDEMATGSGVIDATNALNPTGEAAWVNGLALLQEQIDALIAHVRCPANCPAMSIEIGVEWLPLGPLANVIEFKLQWYIKVSCDVLV